MYPARHYRLSVDADLGPTWDCGPIVKCVDFANNKPLGEPIVIASDEIIESWVIDVGPDHEEVLILASTTPDAGDASERWFEIAAELVGSIELGEPGPTVFSGRPWERGLNATIPPGTVELPIGPGVRFELDQRVTVQQQRGWAYMVVSRQGLAIAPNVEVVAAPFDTDGEPIDSPARLIELLVEAGGVVAGTVEVAGREATVVELLGVRPGRPVFLQTAPIDDLPTEPITWWTQDFVRFVVLDSSTGVIGVTAEAEDDEGLAVSVAVQENDPRFARST